MQQRYDADFTIHQYEIEVERCGVPYTIIPFGDIHRHAPRCDVERWTEFLKKAKTIPNAYFLGMGDYDEMLSASERKVMVHGGLHESTLDIIDKVYYEQIDRLCDEISFMRGRTIGLIQGNHYAKLSTGATSTSIMCHKLDCRFLGDIALVRLRFVSRSRKMVWNVDLLVAHGKGAARFIGTSLKQVEDLKAVADANVYLCGHDHKLNVGKACVLRLSGESNVSLHTRRMVFARTGSFLRGYVPDAKSYVASRAIPPSQIGSIQIVMTPKHNGSNSKMDEVDISVTL